MDNVIQIGDGTFTVTLPFVPPTLLWLAGFGIVLFLLLALLHRWKDRATATKRAATLWRGLTTFLRRIYLAILIPFGLALIGLALFVYLWKIPGLIGQIVTLLGGALDTAQDATGAPTPLTGDAGDDAGSRWSLDVRNYAYAFGALAASMAFLATVPFQLVRVWINERTARNAEENLTTDLINKAVEGLGAEKEVNRLGRDIGWKVGKDEFYAFEWSDEPSPLPAGQVLNHGLTTGWRVMASTVPNLEVRIGAIYQLERIARIQAHLGSPQGAADHIRIMKILCAYVRENSHAEPPQDIGMEPWRAYPRQADQQRLERRAQWRKARARALHRRVAALHKPRTDIQTALEVLGSRDDTQFRIERADIRTGQKDGYRLDLRGANLQAAALAHLDFRHADFRKARLEGVDLSRSQVDLANFSKAWLSGARLKRTQSSKANFEMALMEGADFSDAQMHSASLVGAQMQGVNFIRARMKRTLLIWVQMEGAAIMGARLQGASVNQAQLQEVVFRGAQMEGVDLGRANLKGADLTGTINAASLAQFADLRGGVDLDQSRLLSLIGNAATLLPETPDGDPDLFLPSCWTADPPGFAHLMAGSARMGISETELRNRETGLFCAPGDRPVKTGTPWPRDRDPPWVEEGIDINDWAEREDARRRADGPFLDPGD